MQAPTDSFRDLGRLLCRLLQILSGTSVACNAGSYRFFPGPRSPAMQAPTDSFRDLGRLRCRLLQILPGTSVACSAGSYRFFPGPRSPAMQAPTDSFRDLGRLQCRLLQILSGTSVACGAGSYRPAFAFVGACTAGDPMSDPLLHFEEHYQPDSQEYHHDDRYREPVRRCGTGKPCDVHAKQPGYESQRQKNGRDNR